MRAKDRPMTRLAAALLGPEALNALDDGRCPFCFKEVGPFRDKQSEKENEISGLCQTCQDDVFHGQQEK